MRLWLSKSSEVPLREQLVTQIRLGIISGDLSTRQRLPSTRGFGDRLGDRLLYGITALASLIGVLAVAAIVWRIADGAWPAIKVFHLDFLWTNDWNPVTSQFGARDLIIGTIVTSFGAILLAAPVSVAIRFTPSFAL